MLYPDILLYWRGEVGCVLKDYPFRVFGARARLNTSLISLYPFILII